MKYIERKPGLKIYCRECKTEKGEEDFYFYKRDGIYDTYCKECRKNYRNMWNNKHKKISVANEFVAREIKPEFTVSDAIGKLKIGDVFHASPTYRNVRIEREYKVIDIQTYFVTMITKAGWKECFRWEDVRLMMVLGGMS